MAAVRKPKLDSYTWEGVDKQGKKVKGEMDAGSVALVNTSLRRQGINPLKVQRRRGELFKIKQKIKSKDISVFTRQLATMLQAGIPMAQSFDIVGKGHENPSVQQLINSIKQDIESGTSLTHALGKHPLYFDALYCNLVAAGEQAGILDGILEKLATYKEKIEAIKGKIKSALFYPTAVLVVAFIIWRFGAREWRRGAAHIFVSLAIVGAILAPWAVRNYNEFGVLGLSAQTPFVLYTNLAPAVLSVAKGSDFLAERNTFLTQAEYKGDTITLANGGTYAARALEIVRAHPAATLFVATKSLFTFFTNDGFYTLLAVAGYAPRDFTLLLVAARLVWIAITIAAFAGALVYLLKQRSQLAILIILLVAYFALTSTIAAFGTNPRYRLPVDPIILALAAVGGTFLFKHAHSFLQRLNLFRS